MFSSSGKLPLSVAVITKNEAQRLPACLQSAVFADEIVVVDCGSEDKTAQIAESFGVRLFSEKWRGFSDQKQFAVDQCTNDWVLILDADERVPTNTAAVIRAELMNPNRKSSICAFSFKRKNFLHGRWIRYCGWWPDRVLRLVDRTKGRFDGRPVHENWHTAGIVRQLDAAIIHYSFRNYSDMVDKMDRYSDLAARQMYAAGAKVHALSPASHGFWMFVKTYVLERGFLDGFDGFMISFTNAGGSLLKYAKLRELYLEGRRYKPS